MHAMRAPAAGVTLSATFELTEGRFWPARDLLVLCGRTQSGGDTYFCVDNLLINKDNQLCFLAPSSEDTPSEFHVDMWRAPLRLIGSARRARPSTRRQ